MYWMERTEQNTQMNLYAHLPVENNTPDETQGQLVVPIHNICPPYVYQINLRIWQMRHRPVIEK